MDRIPKLGRGRPKPPTIQTDVRQAATDSSDGAIAAKGNGNHSKSTKPDTTDRSTSKNQQPTPSPPTSSAHDQQSRTQQRSGVHQKTLNLKLPKSNYLQKLKRNKGAKHAIDGASTDSSPAPSPAASHQDKLSSNNSAPNPIVSYDGVEESDDGGVPIASNVEKRRKPTMPQFLTLSEQDIGRKYGELVWAERDRLKQGSIAQEDGENRWGHFSQPQDPARGIMDRYVNIKPWNHNRVRLQVPLGELDYVNASKITLNSPSDPSRVPLRFIAMQGPTVPSISYVWRMIWEQSSSPATIVQLTSMMEAGCIKCHEYFPSDPSQPTWTLNEADVWGDGWKARLTLHSTEQTADGAIVKRKLALDVENDKDRQPLEINHFLYSQWPDFDVPSVDDVGTFLDVVRLSREGKDPDSPRIVHCSAGVGRTGTFMALDHLTRELEAGTLEHYHPPDEPGSDLVFDTVDRLRQQRRGMVQGDAQFLFIYRTLRLLWEEKYHGFDTDAGEPAFKRLERGADDPFVEELKTAPAASNNVDVDTETSTGGSQ